MKRIERLLKVMLVVLTSCIGVHIGAIEIPLGLVGTLVEGKTGVTLPAVPIPFGMKSYLTFDPASSDFGLALKNPTAKWHPFELLRGTIGGTLDWLADTTISNLTFSAGIGMLMPVPPLYIAPDVQDTQAFQNLFNISMSGDITLLGIKGNASITFVASQVAGGAGEAAGGKASSIRPVSDAEVATAVANSTAASQQGISGFGLVFKLKVPTKKNAPGITISDIYPDILNTEIGEKLDQIEFKNLSVLFSTVSGGYIDPELKLYVPAYTVAIGGTMVLDGIFEPIAKLFKLTNPQVTVAGTIGPRIQTDLALRVIFSSPIQFEGALKDYVKSGSFQLEITGRPSIGLLGDITVRPTLKDPWLDFIARIGFGAIKSELSGTMKGTWDAPLGISWLSLSDVALELDIETETAVIMGGGLTAKTSIGSTDLMGAFKLSALPAEEIFAFEVDNLSINDIAQEIKLNVPLPDILFKQVKLYVVPDLNPFFQVRIGDLYFDPGISFIADIDIAGLTLQAQTAYNLIPPLIKVGLTAPSLAQLSKALFGGASAKTTTTAANARTARRRLLAMNALKSRKNNPLLLAGITDKLKSAASSAKSGIQSAASTVKSTVSTGVQTVEHGVESAVHTVTSTVSTAVGTITGLATKQLEAIVNMQIKQFLIDIEFTKQVVIVDVATTVAGIPWEYKKEYSANWLMSGVNFAKQIVDDVVSEVKQVKEWL